MLVHVYSYSCTKIINCSYSVNLRSHYKLATRIKLWQLRLTAPSAPLTAPKRIGAHAERLQQYFAVNDVDNAGKQRKILLSGCGAPTYQLIRNLLAPVKPTDKSFYELVKLVKDHHQPPPSEIVQRFSFHSRTRRNGESVSAFVAQLRKLAEYCAFGDTLSDMLRDCIVCSINDQEVQRRLLAETRLTHDKAFALAQALEAADKSAKELEKGLGIHAVFPHTRPRGTTPSSHKQKCYQCGGTNHASQDFRFKDKDCLHCGKNGHTAKVFRSRAKPKAAERPQQQRRPGWSGKTTHHIEEDDVVDPVYTLFDMANRCRCWARSSSTNRHWKWKSTLAQRPRSSARTPTGHCGPMTPPRPSSQAKLSSAHTRERS